MFLLKTIEDGILVLLATVLCKLVSRVAVPYTFPNSEMA